MKSKILQSIISTGALGDATYITTLIEGGYISEETAIRIAVKTGKFNIEQYIVDLQENIATRVRNADLKNKSDVDALKEELNNLLNEIREILPEVVAVIEEEHIEPIILS